jgi:hypothetical protein
MSFKYFDCMTGSMVSTAMNTPLELDDPRLAAAALRPVDIERPRGITVSGNNVPAYSRPYLNDESHNTETTPDSDSYEVALAALRRRHGIGEDGEPEEPPSDAPRHSEQDHGPYKSLLIGTTLTDRERRGIFGAAREG